MLNKKLTEAEIQKMLAWARNTKKGPMNNVQRSMVERIEELDRNHWRGYRAESETATLEEAQAQLKRLRKQNI